MDTQQKQTYRVLSMYERLNKGHVLTKKAEADLFRVTEKTIQRDFDSIRAFLETEKTNEYLEYDRKQKIYRLMRDHETFLKNEEVLAIVKILVESRAFPKFEMDQLINKLTALAPTTDQRFIKKLMLNEKFLYVDLQHKRSLFTMLWKLAKAVHTKRLIKIFYKREHDLKENERILKPVGLIFSEYYFYLIAYQTKNERNFPTIYRVDRILRCEELDQQFKPEESHRFEEGEFRKRIQFMHAGELMTIKFRFTGASPQAVLDRLPTARMSKEDDKSYLFEAEVFGNGIKMWLLSQGECVEVLSPVSLREEIKQVIKNLSSLYQVDSGVER